MHDGKLHPLSEALPPLNLGPVPPLPMYGIPQRRPSLVDPQVVDRARGLLGMNLNGWRIKPEIEALGGDFNGLRFNYKFPVER